MAEKQTQTKSERVQAIADLEELIATSRWFEEQLREARTTYSLTLAGLEAARSVTDVLHEVQAARVRPEMTAAISALESARRKSRISLIRADLAEGSSLTRVANAWGTSRQLISRYLRDTEEPVE